MMIASIAKANCFKKVLVNKNLKKVIRHRLVRKNSKPKVSIFLWINDIFVNVVFTDLL